MDRTLYIIPGWEDGCSDKQYQELAETAKGKGYEVEFKDVDWKKPLSQQMFAVPENAVIFGFSLGAILAWLVTQKYPCEHLILASMTPRHNLTDSEIKKALVDLAGQEFVDDAINSLELKNQAKRQTILYGELEDEPGDILVPSTEHELNDRYIEEIRKIL